MHDYLLWFKRVGMNVRTSVLTHLGHSITQRYIKGYIGYPFPHADAFKHIRSRQQMNEQVLLLTHCFQIYL